MSMAHNLINSSTPSHTHTEDTIRQQEATLKLRSTRIQRLKASLSAAQAHTEAVQASAFAAHLSTLRQLELEDAEQQHRCAVRIRGAGVQKSD